MDDTTGTHSSKMMMHHKVVKRSRARATRLLTFAKMDEVRSSFFIR